MKDDLKKVVESLSPPEARIASFPMATCVPLTLIHTDKTKKASYYITQKEESRLHLLLKDIPDVSLSDVSDVIEVNKVKEVLDDTLAQLEDQVTDTTWIQDEEYNNSLMEEEYKNSNE